MNASGDMPPRAMSLLRRILPAEMRADVLADLDELYHRRAVRDGAGPARRWYRAQVLSHGMRFGAERMRGVIADVGLEPTGRGEAEYMYHAVSVAALDPVVVAVHVAGDAAALAPRVITLAEQIDPGLQLRDVVPLQEIVRRRQLPMMVGSVAFGIILLIALIFSAAGLYALMAVSVERRTREIGIRVALGASPQRVLRSIFARAGRQIGGGIFAGNVIILVFVWRSDRGITADVVIALVVVSAIMAAIGVLACAAPARRALRVQPTEALRYG